MPLQFPKDLVGVDIQIVMPEKSVSVVFPVIEPAIENRLPLVPGSLYTLRSETWHSIPTPHGTTRKHIVYIHFPGVRSPKDVESVYAISHTDCNEDWSGQR